jgi:hypothetical protein
MRRIASGSIVGYPISVSARAQRRENPWIPAAFEPNKTVTVLVYKAATTDLRKAKVFFFKRMRDNV